MGDLDDFSLSPEQIENFHLVYKQYVEDEDIGMVPVHAVKDILRTLGHIMKGTDELKEMMTSLDNGYGLCSFECFLPYLTQKLKEEEDEKFYKEMFRILDKKHQGFITCDDLRYILMGLAKEVDLTKEDVDNMIEDIDEDGDGEVTFEEFRNLMTSE